MLTTRTYVWNEKLLELIYVSVITIGCTYGILQLAGTPLDTITTYRSVVVGILVLIMFAALYMLPLVFISDKKDSIFFSVTRDKLKFVGKMYICTMLVMIFTSIFYAMFAGIHILFQKIGWPEHMFSPLPIF